MRTQATTCLLALACLLMAVPAGAADLLQYADQDGAIKTVAVEILRRETEEEFNARIRVAGRLRTLKIPTRLVISFQRGSSEDVNQWSKNLAKARRLMAAGQIATEGTVPGAEEMFTKIAYSTEKGVKGQEEAEAIAPWHNMYATYHLIQARYELGKAGKKEKLDAALKNIEEFRKRTDLKEGRLVSWEVPGPEGTVLEQKVYGWGKNRLTTHVDLYEARVLAAQGKTAEATAAYDKLLERIQRGRLSPILLNEVVMEKAALLALGKGSEEQENVFRTAGTQLSSFADAQPDAFGRQTLRQAANQALLRGADLLLDSAREGKLSYDQPLNRYQMLRDGKGSQDRALFIGAQAGIGICLAEKGEGKSAYEALLDVVVHGYEYPDQMARALYYISKAAPLYAKEIEDAGGRGEFLRVEAARWLEDLQDRYPTSEWASKARAK